jgi:hypothetical protein
MRRVVTEGFAAIGAELDQQLARTRAEGRQADPEALELLPALAGEEECRIAQRYLAEFGPEPGQTGHCELDRSAAFELGLEVLRARIASKAARAKGARRETLQAFGLALDGLSAMIEHAGEAVAAAT